MATRSRWWQRFALLLCEVFATLAILLAGIGVYAMLSYSVEQRRREIGIRLALGATHSSVLGMVFRNGLQLAAIGTGIGLLLEAGAGRALSSLSRAGVGCGAQRTNVVAARPVSTWTNENFSLIMVIFTT